MRDISPTQSPSRSRLSASEADSKDQPRSVSAKASSQFAKRNEPARRFIPKHEANASKALSQSEPADIRKIGVAAKHKRQSIKRNSAAEVVDVVHPDIGGEPAQYDRQVIM
jgi:hypothetical protein